MKTSILRQVTTLHYWLLCVCVILILSVFGRKMQILIVARLDMIWIAAIVFTLLFGALIFFYKRRKIYAIPRGTLIGSFSLLAIYGCAVYFKFLAPVETLHFLIFSCFGWLSAAVFGLLHGIVVVFCMAIGDEIMQYFLPDRFGDIHDVVINTLSGLAGLFLRNK